MGLTVQELKKLIKENNIPNFLIFTGEEWKVQDIYIKQIANVVGLEAKRIDSVSDIVNTLGSKSLFNQDYLYIVRDNKEFMTEEKLQKKVIENLSNNMFILVLTSVDKRLKILKTYKTSLVEFEALKSEILKQYIQKEIDLSDKNCEILMEICDYNYGHCLLEIDKLLNALNFYRANYKLGRGENEIDLGSCYNPEQIVRRLDTNMLFEDFLGDGTIHVPPRDTIWDFIKAFLQNKPKLAYELYQELKELETPTFSILSNLYNNTKQLLQVQTCTSNDIAKTTGLNSWQIRNAKECVNRFSTRDLAVLMRLIQRTESAIKQGKIDESIAIDYIFTAFY